MGFRCGLIGLPNVGKSTILNALSRAHAQESIYPFCTIEPNRGIAAVPDERLEKLFALFPDKKKVPTSIEFVDIAGLVKGASHGEGLGNQFLSYIREVDAVCHVVRCFEVGDIVHVTGEVNPVSDVEIVEMELCLKDLEVVSKQLQKLEKLANSGDRAAQKTVPVLARAKEALEKGESLRKLGFSEEEKIAFRELQPLTLKPVLYICNVNEKDLPEGGPLAQRVAELAQKEGAQSIVISGRVEEDISQMEPKEREEFYKDLGLVESGLVRLIHAGYRLLHLVTFFTTDGPEVRAWTVRQGTHAPQAAGAIHTDFEKGFIRAEVVPCQVLIEAGAMHVAREKGHFHVEGKDYIVQDGDVIHFKFHV